MTLLNRCNLTWFTVAQAARGACVVALCIGVAASGAWADTQRDALAQARYELATSEQVLKRLTERVEAAQASPATRPEERERLDEYLVRVRALVALNRERVRNLERQIADQPAGTPGGPGGVQPVAAATEAEQVAMLDGKLNESLEAFDKLLLDEARKARTRDAESGATQGGGGGSESGAGNRSAGSRNAKSGGDKSGGAGQGTGEAQESGTDAASSGGPQGAAQDGSPGGPVGGRERGVSGSESASAPPPDLGDGNDDDIVARQIRKAAEAEPDPELRKKLWDEYRKYRQDASQGTRPGASG